MRVRGLFVYKKSLIIAPIWHIITPQSQAQTRLAARTIEMRYQMILRFARFTLKHPFLCGVPFFFFGICQRQWWGTQLVVAPLTVYVWCLVFWKLYFLEDDEPKGSPPPKRRKVIYLRNDKHEEGARSRAA